MEPRPVHLQNTAAGVGSDGFVGRDCQVCGVFSIANYFLKFCDRCRIREPMNSKNSRQQNVGQLSSAHNPSRPKVTSQGAALTARDGSPAQPEGRATDLCTCLRILRWHGLQPVGLNHDSSDFFSSLFRPVSGSNRRAVVRRELRRSEAKSRRRDPDRLAHRLFRHARPICRCRAVDPIG